MKQVYNFIHTSPLSAIVLGSLCLLFFNSCNTKKYLEKNELYLKGNTLYYKEELNKQNAAKVTAELPTILQLKPNTGILWIPRHWFYYRDKELNKDNWYWNFINNNVAQKPAIIKKSILDNTANSMTLYLKNNAYFNAHVSYDIDTLRKPHEGAVNWYIYPEEAFTIDSFSIVSNDSTIQKIIRNDWRNSIIREGMLLNADNYNAELQRIVRLLRNRGYPNFSQSYIDKFTVDTTGNINKVTLRVLTPYDSTVHPRYRNRSVYVYSSEVKPLQKKVQQDSLSVLLDTLGVKFVGSHFKVRPAVIAGNIEIRAGALYSRKRYDEAQSGIAGFALYKFPRARLSYDTIDGKYYVDYHFYLNPDSLYTTTLQPAIYYSNISNNTQLLGLSLDMSFTNRNIFGGGESYTIGAEGAAELSLLNITDNNTYTISISNSLSFPRLIPYPFLYNYIETLLPELDENVSSDNHLVRRFLRQADTRTTLNYRYTLRNHAYAYHALSASFGYNWNINENYRLELDHVGIDWWKPTIFPEFYDIIKHNEYFLRSFDQRLLTGFLFRRARLDYATPQANFWGERFGASIELETSGLEVMAIDGVRDLFGSSEDLRIGENRFAKYVRLRLGGTYKRRFPNSTEIAFKVNTGIALRLDTFSVPYIKQFYVGGPYSIRAWPVRGLGPGSHYAPDEVNGNFPPYFTGNFLFEGSAEFRFKLFWYFHGAFFLDVGNVWNIFPDDFEGNTELTWDSYKQIAIGSGFGIRFDYSVFVFRLDLGYPIKNPYKLHGSYFYPVRDWSFGRIQWNIAFGYPF